MKEPAWEPLCFLGLYTVSSVLCLPLLGFHTVAGYTYGTFQGALLVSVCQTVGAACSLIFARLYARANFARPRLRQHMDDCEPHPLL